MDTLINFRRPGLDLELLKVRCQYSRLRYSKLKGSQRIPTETVEALIREIESLRKELSRAKLDAEIFEAMYDVMLTQLGSIKETVEWLWGFWDGNTLIAKPGYADNIRNAWDRLLGAIYTEKT